MEGWHFKWRCSSFLKIVTLPQIFFTHFASKNHPSGFSISGTLAWNGLRSLRSAKNRKPFWNSYFAPCIMHRYILVVSFPLPHRFRFGLLFILDRKYLTCQKIPQNDKTQYIPWEDRLLKSCENKAFFYTRHVQNL